MKYLVAPLKQAVETVDFGSSSSVLVSNRAHRTGRTECINVLCELLAGIRASEDSRPNRHIPWNSSATVTAFDDAGQLDFQALRWERGSGIEAAIGDLPDSSVCVLGYSSGSKCGWYHAGGYLSPRSKHVHNWDTLVQALGLFTCIPDRSFQDVLNECLSVAGVPTLIAGYCTGHEIYVAQFERDNVPIGPTLVTSSEAAGILQVCSMVLPWLLHTRRCSSMGVEALEVCYTLIDDLADGVDLNAVLAVMQRRFPNTRFNTLAFR
jgi:hypothetical protein